MLDSKMLLSPLSYTYLVEKSFTLYFIILSLYTTIDIASSFDIRVEKNVGNNNEFSIASYTRIVVTRATAITIGIFLSTILVLGSSISNAVLPSVRLCIMSSDRVH
jgi:hypothetical protein